MTHRPIPERPFPSAPDRPRPAARALAACRRGLQRGAPAGARRLGAVLPGFVAATSLAASAAPGGEAGADGTYLIWGALLLGAALVLIVVELFVPSGGLIGILAGVCAIGSIAAFFAYDTTWGVATLLTYLALIPLGVWLFFKYWLTSPFGRRMILEGDIERSGHEGDPAAADAARRARMAELQEFVGEDGTAETALRPVGTVRIGDRRLDALAESGVIDAGTPVTVVAAYDNQLKVRAID